MSHLILSLGLIRHLAMPAKLLKLREFLKRLFILKNELIL